MFILFRIKSPLAAISAFSLFLSLSLSLSLFRKILFYFLSYIVYSVKDYYFSNIEYFSLNRNMY